MRVFAIVLLCACDVGEVDVNQLAIDNLAAGVDPCHDKSIRNRVNVQHEPGNPHLFKGTNGKDVIFGTDGDDVILGRDGDDLICGFAGNDLIEGGDGRDVIIAG